MSNIAAHIFSAYSFISNLPLEQLLDVGNSAKNGIPIPSFPEDILIKLCQETKEVFQREDNILKIDGDLIIVGDLHGSFHDLLRIIKYTTEHRSKVLFLGDYIDRGCFSLECITILFSMKVLRQNNIFLIRGNHEFDSICSKYGFKDEIINNKKQKKKYSIEKNDDENIYPNLSDDQFSYPDQYQYTENLYRAFIRTFSYMPISSIVNNTTFCIHGGLSPTLESINDLEMIARPINSFEDDSLLTDILWSDPSSQYSSPYRYSPRGYGYLFNESSVKKFLKDNSLKRIIRAHQFIENGISENFGKKCITVFSASSYSYNMGNQCGIVKINQIDDSIQYKIFQPLRRLHKSKALYYRDVPRNSLYSSLCHPKPASKGKTSRFSNDKNIIACSSSGKIMKTQRYYIGLKKFSHASSALAVNQRTTFPLTHVNPSYKGMSLSVSLSNINQLNDDI